MDRAGAATYIGQRYSEYLSATNRDATDTAPGGLGPSIDDALRHLSVSEAAIPTWAGATPAADEDLRVQLAYRVMGQVVRDLGTTFDISDAGSSMRLSQMRAAAERDLEFTRTAVLARFGTIGVVPGAGTGSPFVDLDLRYTYEDPDDGGFG